MIISVQSAYPSGGFVRLPTVDGKPSIYIMEGSFYEAHGVDEEGLEYLVYWNPRDSYDASCMDEADACDWENPTAIVSLADGRLVEKQKCNSYNRSILRF